MKQNSKEHTLLKTITFAWAVICTAVACLYPASYSILQGSSLVFINGLPEKLASIPFLQYIGNLTISFIWIVIFSVILISTGAIFLNIVKPKNNYKETIYTYFALLGTSFLAGHWILACAFMILAILNLLTKTTVIGILLLAFFAGISPVYSIFILPIKKQLIPKTNIQLPKKYKVIRNLSLGILFVALMYSTSRLGYDANYIYFSDPKLTAISHGLKFFLNDMFVISSFQTGIQFSAIMLVFNDQAARLFSWVNGLVIIFFGLALADKASLTGRAKSILLALMLTSTAFVDLLGDAKVDLTSSAIAIAAVYWMFSKNCRNNNLFAGFFIGLSIASRPYNIFLLSVFTISLYLIRLYLDKDKQNKRDVKPYLRSLFWIGIGAIPPLAFHLVANWAVFSDMLIMLKNTPNISSQNWQWSFDPDKVWIMRALYPFVVTFLNTSQSIGNISPLFIAFVPNILFKSVREKYKLTRPLFEMLLATSITLVLWILLFFTIMEIRYILFLWIVLFIATADIVVSSLDNQKKIDTQILSTIVTVVLVFTIFRVSYISLDSYSPVDNQGNPQCSGFPFCDYLQPINNGAAQGERVLSLLAYRYYLRTDLFACSTKLIEYDRIRDAAKKGSEEFWLEAYQQGYSYIAYEKNYSARHLYIDLIPDPKSAPVWMDTDILAGGPQDEVAAYRIRAQNAPVKQEKTCVKNNGVWKVIDNTTSETEQQ